jgi:hypothetical protein
MASATAVLAIGSSIAIVHLRAPDDDTIACEVVRLPEFHTDTIRELSVNPSNNVRARRRRRCPSLT